MSNQLLRERLWFFFIVTIPFDSFPLAPGGVIKPLCIYPALIYLLIFFRPPIKIKRSSFKGLLFLCLLIIHSFLVSAIVIGDLQGSLKFTYNVFMIICFVFIVNDYYHSLNITDKETFWKRFAKYIIISSYFPIFLGFIQLVFPRIGLSGLADNFSLIFVSKMTDRIQLSSSEPAFASIYIITVLLIGYFFSEGKYRKIYKLILPLLVVLFFATGSTYGIFILLMIPVLYVLVFRRKSIIKAMFLLLMVFFTLYLTYNYLPDYTKSRLIYISIVLSDFSLFSKLIQYDDSIFLRVVNPYLGLLSAKDSYFLGWGGENSYYKFPELIKLHYPEVIDNPQIAPIVEGKVLTSPKNLYTKILSEFGLIWGVFIFFYPIKFIKNMPSVFGLQILICMILSAYLQLDSYSFPLFVTLITLIYSTSEK
jgi:hypothetical protein